MTGRSFVVSLLAVAVVFAIAGRCSAPDPAPLPAKTQARLERHTIQTVVDSTETRRLQGVARQLRAELQEQTSIAARAEGTAQWARLEADSLRASVAVASTAADSARAWHGAYDARSLEADSLRSAGERKDSALAIAAHERMVSDSVFHITAGHAARSDSLITELLPLAQRRDRCRILGFLQCPSRTKVAIAGAGIGAAAVAIGTGKIKIPFAIRF